MTGPRGLAGRDSAAGAAPSFVLDPCVPGGVQPAVRLHTWSGFEGQLFPQPGPSCPLAGSSPSGPAMSLPPGAPRSRPTWTQGGDTDPTSSWEKWQRIRSRGLKLPLGCFRGHGCDPNGLCSGSASTLCCPYASRGPGDGDPAYSGPAVDTGQLPGPRQDVSPQHRDLVGLCTAVPQLHTHGRDPDVCGMNA